jgi:hypothetical protein
MSCSLGFGLKVFSTLARSALSGIAHAVDMVAAVVKTLTP